MCRIAGVLSEQLYHSIAHANQLDQRCVLMKALKEGLKMSVEGAALLALDRPVHCVNAAKNAACCSSIATECICTGIA